MSLLCKSLRIFAIFTAAVALFWVLLAPPARAQGTPHSHAAPPAPTCIPGLIQTSPVSPADAVST